MTTIETNLRLRRLENAEYIVDIRETSRACRKCVLRTQDAIDSALYRTGDPVETGAEEQDVRDALAAMERMFDEIAAIRAAFDAGNADMAKAS